MKQYVFSSAIALCYFASIASCTKKASNDQMIYVHPYGVPIPNTTEWKARGETGMIIHKKTDGVVITEVYKDGLLNGFTTYTFPNSDIIEKQKLFDSGNLLLEMEHYPSGLPKQKKDFQNPDRTLITVWYEDGTPRAQEEYENDLLTRGSYFSLDNELESQVQNGSGIRSIRSGLGDLLSKEVIVDGKRSLQEIYYPSGMPKKVIPYFDGKIQGQCKYFLPTGEPERIEEWKGSEQTGITKLFQNGVCVAQIPYEKGKKNGVERIFKEGDDPATQEICQEISWENNQRHGPSVTVTEDGKQTDWYFNGEKVSKGKYIDLMSSQNSR
jgi:antitoxin component YwqK of YwqJK toxin-antitoxin module